MIEKDWKEELKKCAESPYYFAKTYTNAIIMMSEEEYNQVFRFFGNKTNIIVLKNRSIRNTFKGLDVSDHYPNAIQYLNGRVENSTTFDSEFNSKNRSTEIGLKHHNKLMIFGTGGDMKSQYKSFQKMWINSLFGRRVSEITKELNK